MLCTGRVSTGRNNTYQALPAGEERSRPVSFAQQCHNLEPCYHIMRFRGANRPCPPRRLPHARKRLAVPYRAADSPAERAEYAQPDVAILLTLLSYAYDGLSTKELQLAVQKLLKMGGNAQKQRYCMWLEQARLDEWPGLTLGKQPEAHKTFSFEYVWHPYLS